MKRVDEVEKLMPEEMLEIKLINPIEKAIGNAGCYQFNKACSR